jgi:hypothetical protein
MRRQVVNFHQVLLPFALIIGSSIAILLVWQLVDPLQWERGLVLPDTDDDGLTEEPWVSYGQCASTETGVLPFIVPLAFLFAVIMAMTLSRSWQMRDVQEELSEAKWIFIGIFSHLQVWAIGIPVYLILQGISRDVSYLISMALVVVFSNVFVIVIIGPKMIIDLSSTPKQKKRVTRVSVSGGETQISGIGQAAMFGSHSPSGFNPSAQVSSTDPALQQEDKLRILSLEAEVRDLKSAHGEKGGGAIQEAECSPMVDPGGKPVDSEVEEVEDETPEDDEEHEKKRMSF